MKTEQITEYVAADGTRFRTEAAALKWEAEVAAVAPIMARLPKVHIAHGQYIRHDPQILRQIKREIWDLVLSQYGETYPEWRKWDADSVHPISGVGRVLSDGSGPLSDAWCLLMRFDFTLGREYDQTYFVGHPEEASEQLEVPR